MAGIVGAQTIEIPSTGQPLQIISELPPGAGGAIKNVGGLDLAGDLAGPADCLLFFVGSTGSPGSESQQGQSYFLLSGDSLTLPADLGAVYALAVPNADADSTTITVVYGVEQ